MKSHSGDMESFPHEDGGGGGGRGHLVFVLGGLYCGEPWRGEGYMEEYYILVFGGMIQGLVDS